MVLSQNTNDPEAKEKLLRLLHSKKGHFLTESGRHTDLWFDVDMLFKNIEVLRPIVIELGRKLIKYEIDVVCGPVVGGEKIARIIADECGLKYIYIYICG